MYMTCAFSEGGTQLDREKSKEKGEKKKKKKKNQGQRFLHSKEIERPDICGRNFAYGKSIPWHGLPHSSRVIKII